MTVYISNAIAISMFETAQAVNVEIKPVDVEYVQEWFDQVDVVSAIGHADTATLVSQQIGHTVKSDRISVKLTSDDLLFVSQYIGPRLAEGATVLPEGAEIRYFAVTAR